VQVQQAMNNTTILYTKWWYCGPHYFLLRACCQYVAILHYFEDLIFILWTTRPRMNLNESN